MSASPPLPPPRRPLRRRLFPTVWQVHRWLGLGAGALLLLASLSGSLLVVHHELERLIERDRHTAPPAATGAADRPLADAAQAAATLAPPGYRLFRLLPATASGATHKVLFLSADGTTRWSAFVAPATGEILWSGPDQRLFTPWLLGLHMQLHAGRAGYWVVGAAGVALTLLALTGLYLHRGDLLGSMRQPFRLRLGWRVALADLHKWIGVAALYFPLMLGVTGTIYVVTILRAAPPAVGAAGVDPARLPPLEPMLATARARFPGAEVLRVQFPADASGAANVLLLHRENPPWRKFSTAAFDAADGRLRDVRDAARLTAGEQFRSMLAPLHFGFYGAPWVKWAYFLGGLAPAALALTGAALGWTRTRRSR